MYQKYEVEEDGILSADFHSSRSWILLGHRSGEISVHDYGIGNPVFRFKGHSGPVRTVNFHPSQGIFLTAADDTRLKVWNLDTRKCIVLFKGHEDYIRKAIFHHTYPWIVSCSDDCSIRFWNWMSKESLTVVTGHIHWVVDIDIHISRDLLVSASVDNTVRMWDFSTLRNKVAKKGEYFSVSHLFGEIDAVCSHQFEGFRAGVSWIKLHLEQPLLCVGDGKVVRIFNIDTLREVRTLLGHFGNIASGILLSGIEDSATYSLVTVGADKVIKVWSLRSELSIETLPLTISPKSIVSTSKFGLISLATASNLTVFKLYKQRPVYTVYKHHLYFIRDNWVVHYNAEKKKETRVFRLSGIKNFKPASLSYNPSEHAVLVNFSRYDIHAFQLYFMEDNVKQISPRIKKAAGVSATWISKDRFCHIELTGQGKVVEKNLKNEDVNFAGLSRGFLVEKSKRAEQIIPKCTRLCAGFAAHRVILYDAGYLLHYDVHKRRRIGTLHVGSSFKFKSVVWNHDGSLLAVILDKILYICSKSLKVISSCSLRTGKIKSGAWCSSSGVFLYTTPHQLRYLCKENEEGLVCSLFRLYYITHVTENQVTLIDRQKEVKVLDINGADYQFKSAVLRGQEDEVKRLASTGKILGEAMLKFLKEVSRADIAVHFVKDPAVRFSLAVELSNVDLAFESAEVLNTSDHWEMVAAMAMKFGKLTTAEAAYQRGKLFSQLKFLYIITGQYKKLEKLGKLFAVRRELSNQYEVALVLDDAAVQADLLRNTGNPALSSLVEKTAVDLADIDQVDVNGRRRLAGAVPLHPTLTDWPSTCQLQNT